MCVAAKKSKKYTKTRILDVYSCSKSLMLTPLKSLSPVLIMIK